MLNHNIVKNGTINVFEEQRHRPASLDITFILASLDYPLINIIVSSINGEKIRTQRYQNCSIPDIIYLLFGYDNFFLISFL